MEKTFAILHEIQMKPGQRVLVRLRLGPDHWQFGEWKNGEFHLMPSEFGGKMALSPRCTFQAKISGAEAYEAWVFEAKDYDAEWMVVIASMQEKPHETAQVQNVRVKPVSWWKRIFGKYA